MGDQLYLERFIWFDQQARQERYRPCSRNPLIAQTLAILDKMEQRGSSFARMRDAMLDHGLDEPRLDQQDGFFVVTLPGPDGNYDRIRTSNNISSFVPPAVEARLTDRQRQMMAALVQGDVLTSKLCQEQFNISAPVVAADFKKLIEEGLVERVGAGRATRYVIRSRS
jgi:predicted HTH transcriptional regulator